jgi:DNA (cytosine-5)-methyltransferase 1
MTARKSTMYLEKDKKASYIRDGRAPVPIYEVTSKVMSSIRGKNTKPELELRAALKQTGIAGYSTHLRCLPGRPDISFSKKKLAIFINGCFWHQCPHCNPALPKSHIAFWKKKFNANNLRDSKKLAELKGMDWRTLTIWECQWKKAPKRQIMRIIRALEASHEKVNKINVKKIKVIDLFAGVGGFRVGLESASSPDIRYHFVWSNQWEPGTKKQVASEIYVRRFGAKGHSNVDIAKVSVKEIPNHDLLVGGFPCQDYSVARPLNQAHGIVGIKGVLWWEIHRILHEKERKPRFLFLENVDRLLKSPAGQRGKDFAVMLASLSDLGYIVEWRVINAADYGMPQKRRRVFFLGYRRTSRIGKSILRLQDPIDWVLERGIFSKAFPVKTSKRQLSIIYGPSFPLTGDLFEISKNFNRNQETVSPFHNSGIIIDRKVWTVDTKPQYDGPAIVLGDKLLDESDVPEHFFIEESSFEKWKYLKGAKDEKRYNKGHDFWYQYNEGAIPFPDHLDRPSRTIITSEGGASPSRFKHIIKTPSGRIRRLTPIELERLNMFPDNHTEGYSDITRAFLMGNALVVGVITGIGRELSKKISSI